IIFGPPLRELARTERRAEDDAALLVDDVHAARRPARRLFPGARAICVEGREGLLHDAPDVVPGDDEVAPPPRDTLPVAHEVALVTVRAVEVPELVVGDLEQ